MYDSYRWLKKFYSFNHHRLVAVATVLGIRVEKLLLDVTCMTSAMSHTNNPVTRGQAYASRVGIYDFF